MKTFKERIKFYLIGFGIGIIGVAFIFGQRSCEWLPGNQVKNTIAEKKIIYSDSIKSIMDCAKITSENIYNLLDSDGDVDFSESNPQLKNKEYVFNGENDLKVRFSIHKEFSEIIAVESDCKSENPSTLTLTLPLPQSIVTSIIESNEFMYYDQAEFQIDCYGLKDEDVRAFHKTALINMDKSEAWPKGKGETKKNKYYYLEGLINGKDYSIIYEIGENRTRIKHIIGEGDC
jgi:hypothetical protein